MDTIIAHNVRVQTILVIDLYNIMIPFPASCRIIIYKIKTRRYGILTVMMYVVIQHRKNKY